MTARLRAAGCVFAEEEAALLVAEAGEDGGRLEGMLAERESGRPLEVVVGWAEFLRLKVRVADGVFVPRRRTELLVAVALRHVDATASPRVLDLCCGTGAAGSAVEAARPDAEVWASDVDPRAADCARTNLRAADRVLCGDLFAPLPGSLRGRFDVVIANAPYVPSGEVAFMPPEARDFEPLAALDGGPDGTAIQARIAGEAAEWLAPGGLLVVETSERQAVTTVGHLTTAGFAAGIVRDDELDAVCATGSRHPTSGAA